MFPVHRRVARTLVAGGFLVGVPASAQVDVPQPQIEIAQALRVGVATVSAHTSDRLGLEAASTLVGRGLRARGLGELPVAACHRASSPRLVLCTVGVGLAESHWEGSGSVRLLRHGGARVRFWLLGVDPPAR